MPCDSLPKEEVKRRLRKKELAEAVRRLEEFLRTGTVTVVVDRATGAVAFKGWQAKERRGMTDICAFRKMLTTSGAFRTALARAEALAGRQVDERVIAAGVHSHDGQTFGKD